MRKTLAVLVACIASAALALQLWLIVQAMTAQGASLAAAVWRFLGFFTILTNCAVALVAGACALRPASALAGRRARFAAAVAIAMVGVLYSLALRGLWQPMGWQAVADHALHDVTPPLFLLLWAISSDGRLQWRDALRALAAPVAYGTYALGRGAQDGWHAYWFLDPTKRTPFEMAQSISILLMLFAAAALALVALDRFVLPSLRLPSLRRRVQAP